MTEIEKLAKKIFTECAEDGELVTMAEAEEMAEMEIKAKGVKNYVTTEKSHKSKAKVTKVDTVKVQILSILTKALADGLGIITETERDTKVNFVYNDESYTLTLTKHRKK